MKCVNTRIDATTFFLRPDALHLLSWVARHCLLPEHVIQVNYTQYVSNERLKRSVREERAARSQEARHISDITDRHPAQQYRHSIHAESHGCNLTSEERGFGGGLVVDFPHSSMQVLTTGCSL